MTTREATAAFENERPRLIRVAARVLGNSSEAEDMVQQAWLRLSRTTETIENLPGWLTTVTVRLCLDRLRAKVPLVEEDLETLDEAPDVADAVVSHEELGSALQVVLDELSPNERVAFVLHDSFSFDFPSIAAMLEVSPAAARKLASRARTKISGSTASASPADWEIVDAFLAAAKQGEFARLLTLLAPDVVIGGDAFAVAMGTPAEISGREKVANFFNGAAQTAFPAFIESRAGAAWIDRGIARVAFDFEVRSGLVQRITFRADPAVLESVTRRKDDSFLVRRRSPADISHTPSGAGSDWRFMADEWNAWFISPSLTAACELASQIVEKSPAFAIEARACGLRVRVKDVENTVLEEISAAALTLGLTADPSVLQSVSVVIESPTPADVSVFWQRILNYSSDSALLTDPLRRDPTFRFDLTADSRVLRNRIHVDVVRPSGEVHSLGLGDGYGPFGVCHADADGNEVDLVPGSALDSNVEVSNFQAVFSAMACYAVDSVAQQVSLAVGAAKIADEAGFPLLIDLRPGLVILDSGKDQWETEAHGLPVDFVELAASLQRLARSLEAVAIPTVPRFVQFVIDAADVSGVRNFWATTLGYVSDSREGVTDLFDPLRLNPILMFQPIDTSDTARRQQRNRISFELSVPADVAQSRYGASIAAGGSLVDSGDGWWLISDPENNLLRLEGL